MVNNTVLSGLVVDISGDEVSYQVNIPNRDPMVVTTIFEPEVVKDIKTILDDGDAPIVSVSGFLIPDENGGFGFIPMSVGITAIKHAQKFMA